MAKLAFNQTRGLRTWIEIDTSALKNNYNIFRKQAPGKKLMAVAKSNAYGHGLVPFSKFVEKLGVDWIGVDSVKEALRLRKEGVKKPILVLGYTLPENIKLAIEGDISITLSSLDTLKNLAKLPSDSKKNLRFHIKVDTGMSRQGFLLEELNKVLSLIKKSSLGDSVQGLYTHFASAKNPSFPADTKKQIKKFKQATALFKKENKKIMVHASATSGALLFPEAHFDMVRVGIGLYGLWPSKEVEAAFSDKINLKPALTWKTTVGEVKKLPKGNGVGYDFSETLDRDSTLAICPIGYWHGYPRVLSSVGRVLVGESKAKLLGKVSMDMIVVDVTNLKKVKVGSEVVLMGKQGKREISADEFAFLSDTINYEVVTRLNPLIRRIYN